MKKIPDQSVVRLDGPDTESGQAFVMWGRDEVAFEGVMKVILGFMKRARCDSQKPDELLRIIAAKPFGRVAGRRVSRLSDLSTVPNIA